jgi:hypothetical protein
MRALLSWTVLVIASFATAALGQDQSAISGPILGFIEDPNGASIQPIRGVLGASILGQPLTLGSEIRNTVISPKQDYALAVRSDGGEVVLIPLSSSPLRLDSLSGVHAGATRLAISPSGTAAAVFGQDRTVQSIRRLPDTPELVFQVDVSDIPGHLQGLAVADDGTLALLNFITPGDTTLWVVSSNGSRWVLPAQRPSAATFLTNRHDVLIADDAAQEVFLLSNIDQEASRLSVASFGDGFHAFSGVASSEDGLHVFVTSRKSETVTLIDLERGLSVPLPCHCQATGFRALKGTSVFRLSDLTDSPIAILDASSAEPRIVVLPITSPATVPPPEEVTQQLTAPTLPTPGRERAPHPPVSTSGRIPVPQQDRTK